MSIKTNEISELIKVEIKNFENVIKHNNDVGTIVTIGDGIALVYGLEKAMLGELLIFNDNEYGMVMNLDEDAVSAVMLSNSSNVKEGDKVTRTRKVVETPVGDAMLGRVVNALGEPIDDMGEIKATEYREIERIAPGIMKRESVNEPLETGILAIDSMIPIGRGQRELIIGDRQTGKTAIAIDTILNQKGKNVYCIYVAIGQKNSTVASIYEKLRKNGALEYSVIVNASASEISPLQYIAPYTGVTIAEHWCEEGKDVLIVFDDLSKHAVAYRTLSLLLKRSPGREAYPGDIFYLHSRLLERCAKLNKKLGGGSITALPIVETLAGDISAYIPTNIISITDGQIFLSTDLFNAGQRPAINVGFSVSRVGSAAQTKAVKEVSKSLKMELASFNELQAFTQFGSDLDKNTKDIIHHGQVLNTVLKQPQYKSLSMEEEVVYIFATKNRYLENLEFDEIHKFLEDLFKYIKQFHKEVLDKISFSKELKKEDQEKLKEAIDQFVSERAVSE